MNAPYTGRREDARLVTGAGRYTADWDRPGQLHAVFLRADRAHAILRNIDISAALAAPGVAAVLTATDMVKAGATRGHAHVPYKGRGEPVRAPDTPALAHDRIRYVGEPIALIAADTAHHAQDAAELIVIDYDDLPAITDLARALEPDAPQLHDSIPGNLCFDFDFGNEQAVTEAFATATHIVRLEQESARIVGNPMEPKAALAEWTGDTLDFWSSSQGLNGLRDNLAGLLGMSPRNIRIHAHDVGGAFGIRGGAYPEYAALAVAARTTGRPVKWIATRSETFLSDYHGRALRMKAELALDEAGRFLAIRHDWICDIGAYPSAAGPVTNTQNASLMASGAYRIPAIYGRTRLAVANTVPITAYRGAGRPDMAYIVERLVDEAASQTGIDRITLRRRNLIPSDAFPYRISTAVMPAAYDSADLEALLDAAIAESDWNSFETRRAASAATGKLRGIGCALFIEPAGGVSPTDEAALTFEPDGSLLLHNVVTASGQGHETVLPEIVGRALQIDPLRITVRAARNDSPALKGAGAFGSRSMMSVGACSVTAAEMVLQKGHALAADALEAAEADIVYDKGAFRITGTDRLITLTDLAQRYPGQLDSTAELPAPRAFPSGAHVAEVEIDPATGTPELVRYTSIDDCGIVLNQTLVEGQILGGLLQGLGQVFGEICRYDSDGQMLNGSFMDYTMPRADLMKHITIRLLPCPSPNNRLGVKGVGEAGTVGSLPAAMNAMLDALAPAGVTHLDMPATAQAVWQKLQGQASEAVLF
jgi:carbon-monoxide dehydrogenase large subunit